MNSLLAIQKDLSPTSVLLKFGLAEKAEIAATLQNRAQNLCVNTN